MLSGADSKRAYGCISVRTRHSEAKRTLRESAEARCSAALGVWILAVCCSLCTLVFVGFGAFIELPSNRRGHLQRLSLGTE